MPGWHLVDCYKCLRSFVLKLDFFKTTPLSAETSTMRCSLIHSLGSPILDIFNPFVTANPNTSR